MKGKITMTKLKQGQKFADLHPNRKGRIVVVEAINDQFFDDWTEVRVRSNRGYTTYVSFTRLTNPSRFRALKSPQRS